MSTRGAAAALAVPLMMACCVFAMAQVKIETPKITVIGKLTRVVAIGGESSGWSVQLDSHNTMDGKDMDSIEVKFSDPKRAAKYENRHVKITGTVMHVQGIETGDRLVLEVTSIKVAKAARSAG